MSKQTDYHSYMLRIWRTSNGEKSVWSASLERPGSNERLGFADLEALFRYLQDKTHTKQLATGRLVDKS